MKEHNIDQLFRQKLQQHSVNPTPAAWDKVAAGLNTRRRKRGGYYAAAAAVVLLLTVSWFWLQQTDIVNGDQLQTVAVTEQPKSSQSATAEPELPEASTATTASTSEPAPVQVATTETATPATTPKTSKAAKALPGLSPANAPAVANAETAPSVQPAEEVGTMPETVLAQALPVAPIRQAENIAVELQLPALPSAEAVLANTEQVVIRYDAANNDNKQEQTSEKVLSILHKVKQGEIGLADIREAKDNLLSGRFNKP